MKCRLLRAMPWVRRAHRQGIAPVGTTIDHPDAWQLVRLGYAESADDECAQVANMTPETMRLAQEECEMRERGIHPDDRENYRDGKMTGYNPDGNPIPGPNAEPEQEEDEPLSFYLPETYGE